MAQGSRTNRVFLENTQHFQLGPSKELPDGEVVTLQRGWNEVPEKLKDHPIIKRLTPESESEGEHRQKVIEAEQKRSEAISQAEVEYREVVNEAEKARAEEINQKTEERAKRMEEARRMGEVRYEPHPDPDAAHAEALTLPPSMHVVSATGMAYKGAENSAQAQQRVMDQRHETTAPAASSQPGARRDEPQRGTAPAGRGEHR